MKTSLQTKLDEAAKVIGKIDLSQFDTPDDGKVSKSDLNALEKILDRLFKDLNIDIEFTRHWRERVNDKRNKQQITVSEIESLFRKIHQKYADVLKSADVDWQAVLKDINSQINIPFVFNWDKKEGLQLVAKTVMRKKNFKTPNPVLKV
jgi:hypothetical protein